MDQGLKERLIGAAVLVALGVWLIPWLLDGASGPAEETKPALELPVPAGDAADAEVRTEVVDLDAEQPPSAAGAIDASAPRERTRADAPQGRSFAPRAEQAAASARDGAPSTNGSESSGHETSSDAAPPSAGQASAAQAGAAQPSAARASPAQSSETQSSSTRSSSAETGAVQANARPSSAASAPRAKESGAKAPVPATAATGDWAVQLGSFGDKQNAERLASRAGVLGTKPQISTFKADGRLMYRVRLGPYATKERAEAAASSLKAHGFVARVVAAD
ncbi:MAG TPA: SPOR domain-containing protein [Gammaproteobacteria bacterium]|nr:SPOR domain-containing protein [Gammaproteobacteria bacterium]